MKKIMVAIFVLAFAGVALAGEKKCDTVSDAEDLWNFNLKSEALACLDEIIQADPTNAKAHFLKGKMCLATNDYICAKERFGAGPVKATYRSEIAELYKAIGDNRFASGNAKEAEGYYREASLYNPALAKTIASELAKKGKELNSDNNYLTVAVRLDPSLKTGIADHFASLSENSETDEEKVDNLKRSSQYDAMKYGQKANDASEALGRAFLAKAIENARKVGQEANTEKFKAFARKYLGDAVVESELPEVREYQPNKEKYRFPLIVDEQSTHWIKIDGFDTTLFAEKECQFDRLYEDGYVAKKGESRSQNKTIKFKLRAYSNCTQNGGIGLLVE